jgi:N-acetylmuramoyl-L-alanine amidase
MSVTEALLTNAAFGYPTRGHLRRHTPHILAVVHQTATTPYDGQAMKLRDARNGAGFVGNTATFYVDQDGDAVHAVDGTRFVSWCSAPEKISYIDASRVSMATVKAHFAAGFNPNECVWEQLECVGTGAEPWTAAQFEFVAGIIAARAKASGLPINRETVVPHRDMNTVNRPSDPWPAATREARLATLIARAKVLAGIVTPPAPKSGVVLKYGGYAGFRGTWRVNGDHTNERRSPYITATNVIRQVNAGTMFANAQTTDKGTVVGGSGRWLGSADGNTWIHVSMVTLVK